MLPDVSIGPFLFLCRNRHCLPQLLFNLTGGSTKTNVKGETAFDTELKIYKSCKSFYKRYSFGML